MIPRKTVLVLGAGASMHLGFPSGRGLVTDVVAGLRKPISPLFLQMVTAGFDETQIALFRDALARSGRPSVDVFLEHRSEFMTIGKTAIAALLVPHEVEAKLYAPGNWYEYLFKHLGPSRDDLAAGNLSIVTFNYDRSIEQYLYEAIRNSFNLATTQTLEYFDYGASPVVYDHTIPIIHVYGKLGELPHAGVTDKTRAYQAPDLADISAIARTAGSGIKIMHEGGGGDNPALGRARQLIREADVICFLGFGYLEENLNRLGLDGRKRDAVVWGSAYDVGFGERAPIEKYFASHDGKRGIELGNASQNVLEFLRQHPVLV